MDLWAKIGADIGAWTGIPCTPGRPRSLGGGCINQSWVLSDGRRQFFVKLNDAYRLDMFQAEAEGLAELAQAGAFRVPAALGTGSQGSQAYLVLEYIELNSGRGAGPADAGRCLAQLHRRVAAGFGWRRDNYIGATPQPNGQDTDWARFWAQRRLGFQLQLAARNGHGGPLRSQGERLLERLPALLDHAPPPSLLHGDLWGGNLGYAPDGQPVIYDPAVYYGDREADLAMTELFGGFPPAFYAAYRDAWPLDPGYGVRRTLYNLYHILNHLNLFGGGYSRQALGMIEQLLAELGSR